MTKLTIELPDPMSEQLQAKGISLQQLVNVILQWIKIYLGEQTTVNITVTDSHSVTEPPPPRPRFGSGKHLDIVMADDFDEPLEDFAEYMA
ncbi:hypothetical protein QUF63_16335 [Anaerolineales bacterium HSG25]|nr:hypothetical protein [Anaerolineales bacterium HSG25]